ncbi:hypothetical protein Forpi1262_v007046 [Fusarium oxysporum f. sp. raphani]|uniref:Nucleoside phosphorylase domain-containing protein n=1 Tax=Fusarium oxysporum f. sp. raphani TaxID=96318 RepID=A0A8J5Q2Y1_FUSOX|nr:hypothetical protein Forpi1262_v007046 [Fusarium oxysporum f. sp. raphani]
MNQNLACYYKRKLEDDGRADEAQTPNVIPGPVVSTEDVLRDPDKRDNLGTKGTVAIEMEADAVCEAFPCIVIKGVSDYADSHKNDAYQDYAVSLVSVPVFYLRKNAVCQHYTGSTGSV